MSKEYRMERARGGAARRPPCARRLAGALTAGAAAMALVLAVALPARAGDRGEDLAKALIAALVIGAIVHETKKDDPAPAPAPVDGPRYKKRWKPDQPRIPEVCALEFVGERQSVTVYPESCLRQEGVTRHLPRYCARDARIFGAWDQVFSETCLREAGFALPGDHRRY